AAVSKTAPVTGKDLSLPVLECVLLVAENNTLTIRATNLDLGIEVTIPVKVEESGTVAVPADILRSFLSNLPYDDSVSLVADDTTLKVTTSQSETEIHTQDYDEFPSIPSVSEGDTVTIPSEKLIKGFESVYYSASPSSMKPELSSVNMFTNDGSVMFVATDSFRLAEKKVNVKNVKEFDSVLIPFENVSEVVRTFSGEGGEVEIDIGENQISFSLDGIYVTSRVIDGVFPDYQQIKQDLLNTLKLSNIFSDKFNKITLTVIPEEKEFSIRTQNADIGENVGKVDASLSGGDLTASFNYRYVMDCFQSINTDSVSLELSQN
ncbi:MAG: DNA polymerase III subunit beta, partial [Flavobacteriales bacterium]